MTAEQQQLRTAITALEQQRAALGDAVADLALAPLRARLAALGAPPASLPAQAAPPTPAAPATPDAQALRLVSILFLDMVGSTTLSQRLDPEQLHQLLDGALQRCTAIVQRYQGRVLQYAGDNLLAVFGADAAQEDDAERALRAGLDLLAEGRRLGQQVLAEHGHSGFGLRLGVHSGTVLLGGGVEGEASIRGMAVNIAARMEQSAPPGALRISHDTAQLVRGLFELGPQPPIQVKGVDRPIRSHLVLAALALAPQIANRGLDGLATPMVGRGAELARLQQAWRALPGQAEPSAWLVVAEAGIGKSRLLREFQAWLASQPSPSCVFEGRAQPSSQARPYGLLCDLLAWALQIDAQLGMAAACARLEQAMAALWPADDPAAQTQAQAHAHLLGHLMGLDLAASPHLKGILADGRQLRSRGFAAAEQLLRRSAARAGAPLLLLLDDLHWADEASLDFFDHLLQGPAQTQPQTQPPLLLLALTRPALFERRPQGLGGARARRLDLAQLDHGHSQQLVDALLQRLPQVPDELRQRLLAGAEGNPFYLEELVKMLLDQGAIQRDGQAWTLQADPLQVLALPATLTGVLQARLDSLPSADKRALQQASVIGPVFWQQALAEVAQPALASLPTLGRRALTVQHDSASVEGTLEYAFSHQLLHQVTYGTVLKPMRRELHARTAAWLAGQRGARARDHLAATAEHYLQAGLNDEACRCLTEAAEHAAERFAHEAALGHVAQALGLLAAMPPTTAPAQADVLAELQSRMQRRWQLVQLRERLLDLQGRRAEQADDIAVLQQLADALQDKARRAEVCWRQCDLALRTGDYAHSERSARQAMDLATQAGDEPLALKSRKRLADALNMLGQVDAAKALAEEGLAMARAKGWRQLESLMLNSLSVIASKQGDVVNNLALDEQTLAIDRELHNLRGEASTLANLGLSWLNLGQNERAAEQLEQGLRLSTLVGNRAMQAVPLINLSRLSLRQAQPGRGLQQASQALAIARAVNDPFNTSGALCRLGHAQRALGDAQGAASSFEQALAIGLQEQDVIAHDARAGLARLALDRADLGTALALVDELLPALAQAGALQGCDCAREVWLACCQVLHQASDRRADALLAQAHAALQAEAATIADPTLRHSFLTRLPEHQQIVALFAARG